MKQKRLNRKLKEAIKNKDLFLAHVLNQYIRTNESYWKLILSTSLLLLAILLAGAWLAFMSWFAMRNPNQGFNLLFAFGVFVYALATGPGRIYQGIITLKVIGRTRKIIISTLKSLDKQS